jgi:cyclic pyranopterin phosphate synthase
MARFTHLDKKGRARMVDVSGKKPTLREARARGTVRMKRSTLDRIIEGDIEKGDVLGVARIAAIQAVKLTPTLIPLCHPLNIGDVEVSFKPELRPPGIIVDVTVRLVGVTGAEMEAMTAVAVAGLTIYDMCKAVDREMTIGEIKLMKKSGGKSGIFRRTK